MQLRYYPIYNQILQMVLHPHSHYNYKYFHQNNNMAGFVVDAMVGIETGHELIN